MSGVRERCFDARERALAEIANASREYLDRIVAEKGVMRLGVGGGATQRQLNQYMVHAWSSSRATSRVKIYLSDERCVPEDDPYSNYGMIRETLVLPLNMPVENLTRVPVELGATLAARAYADDLADGLGGSKAEPTLDLAILGVGTDGHTASLFPNGEALKEEEALAAPGGYGPEGLERVTLTYPALARAKEVWILALGVEKQRIVQAILGSRNGLEYCPVSELVERAQGRVTLWSDRGTTTASHDDYMAVHTKI